MSEQSENELSGWFSTYGLITAQRILERYRIKLHQEDLLCALKTPETFYHQLLRLPLGHVFNGIILQQVQDYQLYAQKLIIDYLLSGESSREEGTPGEGARNDLEQERQVLVSLNTEFHELELEHEKLIANSQAKLIERANDWHKKLMAIIREIRAGLQRGGISINEEIINQALPALLCNFNFKANTLTKPDAWQRTEKILNTSLNEELRHQILDKLSDLGNYTEDFDNNLADFAEQVSYIGKRLREFRDNFYNLILRAKEIIYLLPDYRLDLAQEAANKESLLFNAKLGDSEFN
ncbi:Uncharacterised protein [Legionella busanensis]|uniref:Uncharacterized protein n=1 Tax=Legionella busanensis TaxID=190655 RepID=A0A378JKT7_9GAMM|nr:hypothetical protein [Legionella busanensis]STX51697.1 Uncharacterised protein [Legionella busanensis]